MSKEAREAAIKLLNKIKPVLKAKVEELTKSEHQPHPGSSLSEHQKMHDAKKQAEKEQHLKSPEGEKARQENNKKLFKDEDCGADMAMSEMDKASPDQMAAKQAAQPKQKSLPKVASLMNPAKASLTEQPKKLIPETPTLPKQTTAKKTSEVAKAPVAKAPKPLGSFLNNKNNKMGA